MLGVLLACQQHSDTPAQNVDVTALASAPVKDPALVQKYCHTCHNPLSASHDLIIAPPLAAIKMRYHRIYRNEPEFVKAMYDFVKNPTEENVLMYGAKQQFGLMPKMEIDSASLVEIVRFIFSGKPEEPAWFAAHMGNSPGPKQ